MANSYKNAAVVLSSTGATNLYTCPAATRAIVQSVNVANIDGSDRYVTITWYDASSGSSYTLLNNALIPSGTAMNTIDAAVVLEAGDIIRCQATTANTLHVTASILEQDPTSAFPEQSVTTTKIANNAVTSAKMATGVSPTIICTSSTRPSSPFAGQQIYETDTNKLWIYNGTSWVSPSLTFRPPSARVLATGTAQTLPTGQLTPITFPAEDYDPDNMHSTVSNTSRIVVQQAGLYLVNTYVGTGAAGGNKYIYILKSGAQWMFKAAVTDPTSSASAGIGDSICAVVPCAVNDYIESGVFHNTGSSINVSTLCWLSVSWYGQYA